MALDEREIAQDLAERQHADQVFDRWGATRVFYNDWQDDYENLARIARNEFVMEWPDGRREQVDPSVPNMVDIASKDRAAVIASTVAQVICQPEGPGDEAREKADKLERIVGGHLQMNRIQAQTWDWAFDAMAGGLTVCKVMPDLTKPERFPVMTRLRPQLSYPDPIFTRGPNVDSFIYAYDEYRSVVENDYGEELPWARDERPMKEQVHVIERYDSDRMQVVVRSMGNNPNNRKTAMIVNFQHKLGCVPIAIGTSANIHGTYSGEFEAGLGLLETWHRVNTMVLDDAARKTYAQKLIFDIINPQDDGPDAVLEAETKDARFEYINQPNQPYSNLQILTQLGNSVRAAYLLPLARSGNPDESIISAAGINASQTQFNTAVQTTQRLVIGPMLEAAIELGLISEEMWSPNKEKNVYGGKGRGYRETYTPSKDIKGYRNVRIAYGPMGGLDPVNQAVLMQQFHGNGGMSTRRMLELNPMIEDPQREEKQMLAEQLEQALITSVLQRAAQGTLDPHVIAYITQAVSSDEVSLAEAVAALVEPAPQPVAVGTAPGQGTPPGPGGGPPGLPGAAAGPAPPQQQTQVQSASQAGTGPIRGSVTTRRRTG